MDIVMALEAVTQMTEPQTYLPVIHVLAQVMKQQFLHQITVIQVTIAIAENVPHQFGGLLVIVQDFVEQAQTQLTLIKRQYMHLLEDP